MNKIFHAYIDEQDRRYSLIQHSIDTLTVVLETSLNNRVRTITNRLTDEPKYREHVHSYLLLSFLLHDIGKIMILYQERPRGWKYKYQFHELVSGLVLYKILDKLLQDDIGDVDFRIIKYLIVNSTRRHHYTMLRDLRVFINAYNEYLSDYLRGEYNVIRRDDLKLFISRLISCFKNCYDKNIPILIEILERINDSILPELIDNIVFSLRNLDDLMINISRLERSLVSEEGFNEIYIYDTILTGLLSLADYTAASIERSGNIKGYVLKIFSQHEIIKLKNLIPVQCLY